MTHRLIPLIAALGLAAGLNPEKRVRPRFLSSRPSQVRHRPA
jgi:hypothetical protein